MTNLQVISAALAILASWGLVYWFAARTSQTKTILMVETGKWAAKWILIWGTMVALIALAGYEHMQYLTSQADTRVAEVRLDAASQELHELKAQVEFLREQGAKPQASPTQSLR